MLEGGGESDLVGVRQIDTERKAAGKASNGEFGVFFGESFLEQEGGRFAFDGRIGGQNYFFHVVVFDAGNEFGDVELVWGNAVERGKRAA